MILLDTNVLSEPVRKQPDQRVRAWLDAAAPESVFLCAPVLAEIRAGIERLPSGKNRERLERWCADVKTDVFMDRILSFDQRAAHAYGEIVALRERLGRIIKPIDAMIAAIARANGMALATRDAAEFAGLGLDVVNPFDYAAPAAP